jgi:hypothetical protein
MSNGCTSTKRFARVVFKNIRYVQFLQRYRPKFSTIAAVNIVALLCAVLSVIGSITVLAIVCCGVLRGHGWESDRVITSLQPKASAPAVRGE